MDALLGLGCKTEHLKLGLCLKMGDTSKQLDQEILGYHILRQSYLCLVEVTVRQLGM